MTMATLWLALFGLITAQLPDPHPCWSCCRWPTRLVCLGGASGWPAVGPVGPADRSATATSLSTSSAVE